MRRIFCSAAFLTGVASVAVSETKLQNVCEEGMNAMRFAVFILAGYLFAPAVAAQSRDLNTLIPAGVVCPAAMLRPDMQELGRTQISNLKKDFETTSPLELREKYGICSVTDASGVCDPTTLVVVPPSRLVVGLAYRVWKNMVDVGNSNPNTRYVTGRVAGPGTESDHRILFVCFPELKELFFFAQQRLSLASQRAAQEDEARRQQEDAAENTKPDHVLLRSYAEYIYVKRCYDEREGYLSINVSDEELERARTAVRSIEQKLIQVDPSLDKDVLWKRANSEDRDWQTDRDKMFFLLLLTMQSDRDRCQFVLGDLEKAYEALVPTAKGVKKDF